MACAKKLHFDLCHALLQANPAAMFLYDCQSLRILAANGTARARYGYSGQELHSMTVRDLCPDPDGPALNSCPPLNCDAHARLPGTHVNKNGERFAVELSVVPFARGRRRMAILVAVNATACCQARVNLLRSEQLYRSLIEHCPFGIYRYDLFTGRYEEANPALLRLLGYTLEELRTLERPTILADLAERERYRAELLASGSVGEIETLLRCRDGHTLRATVSGYLFHHPGTGHACVQVYVRDTTRQHELEEQFSAVHRMETVARFAGGVAHDFNNITQSISLSCELALRASLPPAVRSKLSGILHQANRAAEITQRLLAFSRRQILQPRAVALNHCIEQAQPALSRALGVNISLDLRLGDSLPPVLVDPDQLTLVLIRLADNARVAMPNGGVLRIATAEVPPNAAANTPSAQAAAESSVPARRYLRLTVSDTGIGMDGPTRQHIFEPFFSTKKTTETAGLGLATVHGIIHQSQGRVECDSAPGCGTTFRIFLPVAEGAAVEAPA